jgi:hypothetical protein
VGAGNDGFAKAPAGIATASSMPLVYVSYDKRRLSPTKDCGLYAFLLDVVTKRFCLVRFKTNENAAMTSSVLRPVLDLIEDQLEPQQADLKHKRSAVFLMIPI